MYIYDIQAFFFSLMFALKPVLLLWNQNATLGCWFDSSLLWPFPLLSFAPMQGITENYALKFCIIIWQHVVNLLLNTNYEPHLISAYISKTTDSEGRSFYYQK